MFRNRKLWWFGGVALGGGLCACNYEPTYKLGEGSFRLARSLKTV